MILTHDGKVPWTAMIEYDEKRCGFIAMCNASDTLEQAHTDARQWLRDRQEQSTDLYLQPSCRISVGYKNIIDGSRT